MLRREGSDTIVAASFYRTVVQSVLILGEETWVWTEKILQKMEGLHVGFLKQVAGISVRKMGVDT